MKFAKNSTKSHPSKYTHRHTSEYISCFVWFHFCHTTWCGVLSTLLNNIWKWKKRCRQLFIHFIHLAISPAQTTDTQHNLIANINNNNDNHNGITLTYKKQQQLFNMNNRKMSWRGAVVPEKIFKFLLLLLLLVISVYDIALISYEWVYKKKERRKKKIIKRASNVITNVYATTHNNKYGNK